MAKKGGVQQLQTEINTNEELTKFLDRDGLIVLDVYTEWCGSAIAMTSSLKKIKLEQGGDDLHLAVVKCDQIDVFARFRNKSEPTWLLASKGKLVNSAFGANVPFLVDLILKELDIERRTRDTDPATSGRAYYELHEMTPVEQQRYDIIQKAEEENERIEQQSALKRRVDYLTFVTDKIMTHANDMGVTIIANVMNRDLLKKLTEQADKCRLVAKDKKNIQVLSEHAEVIALCTTDTMPKRFFDYILNRDIFAVCWKLTDSNVDGDKNVEEYIQNYVQLVWNEGESSSVLRAIPIMVDVDPDECAVVDNENEIETEETEQEIEIQSTIAEENDVENDEIEAILDEQKGESKSESEQEAEQEQDEKQEEIENVETNDTNGKINGHEKSQTSPTGSSDGGKKRTSIDTKKAIEHTMSSFVVKNKIEIKIPPIWTPSDKRANAALIYLYFRSLTEVFLPPDPPVERPHIAMIFDAYKKREIMDVIELYRDEILAYGYFTTDNPQTAQLIANSTFNYNKNPPTIHDKLILKVAKVRNSPAIAALKTLGPSYVSKNSEVGKTECLAFFPSGFKNSSETGAATPVPIDETQKKKKKKKRKTKHDSDEENEIDSNQTQNVTQTDVEATEQPEDGELDEDDSADDEDSANEVNETENAAAETTET